MPGLELDLALTSGWDMRDRNAPFGESMKQDTPHPEATTAQVQAGWSVRKLRAQLRVHGTSAWRIAKIHGLSAQGVSQTVRGERQGLRTRQIIAQELGVEVTVIWPDALLPLRERRLRRAS